MPSETENANPKPVSLGTHEIPAERLELVRQHVAVLSETARKVGDLLPLEAAATDIIAVLEARRGRRA